MPNAVVTLQVQSQAAAPIAQTANAYKTLAAEEQKAEIGAQRYALALQKVALADTRTATEEQRLAVQTANVAKAQAQAEGAALKLANAQNKSASGNTYAAQTAQAFGSGIMSIVGPAAVATAAIGAVIATANSFKEAISFKAQLDQTNNSIAILLRGLRDSSEVFAQAKTFADKYKLTQAETTEAISESIPVIRASKSSIEDILGVFTRLTILKPGKSFADASRAIGELQSGQLVSLEKIFNVLPADAQRMAKEIKGGADAIQVLSAYLTRAGVGMDALAVRTQGVSGAQKDLLKAQEDLTLAQAKFAEGPGMVILQGQIRTTSGLTRLLSGDFATMGQSVKNTGIELAASVSGALAYATALANAADAAEAQAAGNAAAAATTRALTGAQGGGGGGTWGTTMLADTAATKLRTTATDEDRVAIGKAQIASQQFSQAIQLEGAAKIEAQIHTADLAKQQAQLEADSIAAAKGIFASGDQAVALAAKYGIAVNAARFLISEQQKIALAAGPTEGRSERDTAGDRNALRTAQQARADAIADARSQRVLATGTTNQQIAERQRLYAEAVKLHGKESAEAISAETDLVQARQAAAAAADKAGRTQQSALSKELNLHESIYDSMAKQRDAALDIEKLSITGRQADRADAQKVKEAQAVLAKLVGRTDARAEDFRGRAQDVIALADVEHRQRAAELANKGATAGAQMINGKLYQGQSGGALPPPPGGTSAGALPLPPGAAGGAAGAGGGAATINLVVDGKVLASVSEPYIMDALMKALRGGNAQRGLG